MELNYFNKRGQVWVETVIYTLIGLTIIGILLAVATPKIEEMKDRLRINEVIDILGKIDLAVTDVRSAPQNARILDLEVSKGKLVVNSTSETIYWKLDSTYEYSQSGKDVAIGDVNVRTKQTGSVYEIKIFKTFDLNISTKDSSGTTTDFLELDEASIPYNLRIASVGSYGQSLEVVFSIN